MDPEFCPNGHERTEENTSWVKRSDRPGLRRRCKDCRRKGGVQTVEHRIEDVEDLLSFGATLNEIVERSAYKNWESMQEALRKAGRIDLVETLKAKLADVANVPRRDVSQRKPSCTVRACGRKKYAKGHCKKHYNHKRLTGNPMPKPRPKRVCGVQDCKEKYRSAGYCNKHRKRLERHGDPLKITRKEPSA